MVKVTRSFPPPPSLIKEASKNSGEYNKRDVIERLKQDFFDKCYICEIKGLQDPEVEHLLPHKNGRYPERIFDWNNLFWCCGHCNKIKSNRKYDSGIIDCCRQDPEELLSHKLAGNDISIYAVMPDDRQSELTAELIYEVFNLKNTGIREAASENRIQSLMKSMNVLYRELELYREQPASKKHLRILKALLRRDSEFAAFKRCYIRDNKKKFPELQVFID